MGASWNIRPWGVKLGPSKRHPDHSKRNHRVTPKSSKIGPCFCFGKVFCPNFTLPQRFGLSSQKRIRSAPVLWDHPPVKAAIWLPLTNWWTAMWPGERNGVRIGGRESNWQGVFYGIDITSGKLRQQWKIHHLKMYFLLEKVNFHCHVSLLEGTYCATT